MVTTRSGGVASHDAAVEPDLLVDSTRHSTRCEGSAVGMQPPVTAPINRGRQAHNIDSIYRETAGRSTSRSTLTDRPYLAPDTVAPLLVTP